MYAFKSSELIRRLRRSSIAGQRVILFKHSIDDRYAEYSVVTHDGESLSAIPVTSSEKLYDLRDDADVIGVDEAQFFDENIVSVLTQLADSGKTVIVSGLDTDFMGQPFRITADLMARAERVDKFTAVCTGCSTRENVEPATRTQLFDNGYAVTNSDENIKVGGPESYSPRCRSCFVTSQNKVQA